MSPPVVFQWAEGTSTLSLLQLASTGGILAEKEDDTRPTIHHSRSHYYRGEYRTMSGISNDLEQLHMLLLSFNRNLISYE